VLYPRSLSLRKVLSIALVFLITVASSLSANAQTPRSPSDVVREFYKAMRERRFKDAWSMSVYKPGIDGLAADEMEDLRPFFEQQAAPIPEQLQIDGEKITGNSAQVFIRLPPGDSSPQLTSKPVDLIKSGGVWIIGTESEDATVKKAGGRYFLDAANTATYPGHEVANLRVDWLPRADMRASLRIDNVFDTAYADRADFAFGNYRYFPARGRAFFVSFDYATH